MMKVIYFLVDDCFCGWYYFSLLWWLKLVYYGRSVVCWVVVGVGFIGFVVVCQLVLYFFDEEIVLVEVQEVGFGIVGCNVGFVIDLFYDIGVDDYIGDIVIVWIGLKFNFVGQLLFCEQVQCYVIDCQMKVCGKYQVVVEVCGVVVFDVYWCGFDWFGQVYEVIEVDDFLGYIGIVFYCKVLFIFGILLVQFLVLVKGLVDSLLGNVSFYEYILIIVVEYGDRILLSYFYGSILVDCLVFVNNVFGMSFGFFQGWMLLIFIYVSLIWLFDVEEQVCFGGCFYWGLILVDFYGIMVRCILDNCLLICNSFSFNFDGCSVGKYFECFVVCYCVLFCQCFLMFLEVGFDYIWGGLLVLLRNYMGYFGELVFNVYGVLCCNGLGVICGIVIGKLLVDWLVGECNELIDFLLCVFGFSGNLFELFFFFGVNFNLRWGQY